MNFPLIEHVVDPDATDREAADAALFFATLNRLIDEEKIEVREEDGEQRLYLVSG